MERERGGGGGGGGGERSREGDIERGWERRVRGKKRGGKQKQGEMDRGRNEGR